MQLEILQQVDSFCVEQGLRYYLWAGTLLGAVRHQGYIPWDDDIDLAMPREDYSRFCRAFPAQGIGARYSLHSLETDRSYPLAFAKVADDHTVLIDRSVNHPPIGVNIDVFPIDGWPDGACGIVIHRARMRFHHLLVRIWRRGAVRHTRLSRKLVALALRPIISRIAPRTIASWLSHSAQGRSGSFVGVTVSRGVDRTWADAYGAPAPLRFENRNYPAPRDPDRVLTTLYGNYMTLPKERISHHSFEGFWK